MASSKGDNKRKKMKKDERGEKSSPNPTGSNKRVRKNAMVTDPRFASVHSDPRFQRMPKKESKVVIDERFSEMLKDKRFEESSATVDKRGKPKRKEPNPLLHYYLHQDDDKKNGKRKEKKLDEDEDEEEEEENEKQLEEDEEEEEEERREVELEASTEEEEEEEENSSSDEDNSSTDEDDEDQDSVNSDVCHYLMANHEDTPMTEQETYRLAIVNMDWDHIRAVDIYVVMSSCLPRGGQLLSVAIYPTEFGLERIEVEAARGPADLIGRADDDSDEEQEIDDEQLRSYELNKLRYYFAVAVFDSSATANHVYSTLDGIELLKTSNVFDLRFIPDTMEFKHPPRDIITEAPTNYKQPDFETRALQHSKVNLTWEQDETHRTKALRQKFNPDKLDELEEYLATSDSDEEGEEGNDTENEEDEPAPKGESKKHKDKEKVRALLLAENASGSDEEGDKDIEITFNPGLEDLNKRILEKKEKSETVWEQHLRKRSEKRKARKYSKNSSEDDSSDYDDAEEAPDQGDDFFMEEEQSDSPVDLPKSKKKSKSSKKARNKSPEIDKEQEASKAELELLFAEDQEGKEKKGYNMKIRKKKGKKGKEEDVEIKVPDVNPAEDPRFSALLTSHLFALDPTDPQYKRSAAYARNKTEKNKSRRREEAEVEETAEPPEPNEMKSDLSVPLAKEQYELNSAVRSLKRNLQSLKQKQPKAKTR